MPGLFMFMGTEWLRPRMVTKERTMIRIARQEDAKRLLEIYAYYVENTAITFEYEVPSLEDFRGRIRHTLERYPYLVEENEDGQIIGYVYAGAFKERAAYDWAVETSIYVDREERRRGSGRRLYAALEKVLLLQGICNAEACIAAPRGEDPFLTAGSIRFHRHLGYRMVGHFEKCAYKFDRWYDMVWMERLIGDHPEAPGSLQPVKPFPQIRQGAEQILCTDSKGVI